MVDIKNTKTGDKIYFDGNEGLEEGWVTNIENGKISVKGGISELAIDPEDACLKNGTVYFQGDAGTDAARLIGIADGMVWMDYYNQELSMDPSGVFAYSGNV